MNIIYIIISFIISIFISSALENHDRNKDRYKPANKEDPVDSSTTDEIISLTGKPPTRKDLTGTKPKIYNNIKKDGES